MNLQPIHMNNWEFEQLTQLAYQKFGIALGPEKRNLVANRLEPEMKKKGFTNVPEYIRYLKSDSSGQALVTFINRLTTNYSFFFRESDHFDYFRTVALPERLQRPLQKGTPSLNMWSAGCSTGEEPYSLAIILEEIRKQKSMPFPIKLLATDVDTNVLKKAHQGLYAEKQLTNIPPMIRFAYFESKNEDQFQIKGEVRRHVHFSRYNLIREHFSFEHQFFTIFCRNVMIYFDSSTIDRLIKRFHQALEKDGYLFIGMTETLNHHRDLFRYVAPSIYQKISSSTGGR